MDVKGVFEMTKQKKGVRVGRFSARRKQEAVLRLLRGEDLEVLSRELGVMAATLSEWREQFLGGGESALHSRTRDERDEQIARLKAKVGDLTMDNELLESKIHRLEDGPKERPYRLQRVCRVWQFPRSPSTSIGVGRLCVRRSVLSGRNEVPKGRVPTMSYLRRFASC